jgi:sugar lactone lactonase YvrE
MLMPGLVFAESPRWHEGRLWFADWGAHEVVAVDLDGRSEVVARIPAFPFSIDWLPDGMSFPNGMAVTPDNRR